MDDDILTAQMGVKCTDLFSINLDISDVVLEHCWDVDFRKLVFTENNEKTCFPASSVPDNHQLLPNGCHLCWGNERRVFTRICHIHNIPKAKQQDCCVSNLSAVLQKTKETFKPSWEISLVILQEQTQSHFVYCTLRIFKLFVKITGTQDKIQKVFSAHAEWLHSGRSDVSD